MQLSNSSSFNYALFERYGEIRVDNANGEQINRLENLIALDSSFHDAFDNLLLWFKHLNVR